MIEAIHDARRFIVGTAVAAALFALRMLLLSVALLLQRFLGASAG